MNTAPLSRVRSALRLIRVAWWLHVRMYLFSAFEGLLQAVWPLFFATAALLVYRVDGDAQVMIYAGLGSAVMGVWSSVATTASSTLQRERSAGTLEYVVVSPTPLPLVLAPITFALATNGLYSLVATLLWGRLVFRIPFHVGNLPAFALSVVATVAAMGVLGFVLSLVAVRYRTAWALGNLFEYPGWVLCGFIVPLSMLPGWAHPIAYTLAPTWGMRAIRDSMSGGSPWRELAVTAALTAAYLVAGVVASRFVLDAARRSASLSLG